MEDFIKIPNMALKPCPFCGERLIKTSDHHGEWYGHKDEMMWCPVTMFQITDWNDCEFWNRRLKPKTQEAEK